jgi:peptidoglycan/LPS O-acetylase OafA/YrhL
MTLFIALVIGVAPLYLLPRGWNLEWSCPWYVALFAMGMIAAAMSGGSRFATLERWWGTLSIATAFLTVSLFLFHKTGWARVYGWRYLRIEHRGGSWLLDLFVGVTVSFALLSLTRAIRTGRGVTSARLVSALQCKPVSTLGAFSYSLYLIHAPILGLIALAIASLHPGPVLGYVSIYLAGVPLGLLAAYLFYLGVERHCVSSRKRQRVAELVGPAAGTGLPNEVVPSL